MTPAAEIQRRYRARRAAGLRVIPVVVDAALVEDALIARGFLRRTRRRKPQSRSRVEIRDRNDDRAAGRAGGLDRQHT
jgi:hypothetical protein